MGGGAVLIHFHLVYCAIVEDKRVLASTMQSLEFAWVRIFFLILLWSSIHSLCFLSFAYGMVMHILPHYMLGFIICFVDYFIGDYS